MKLSKPTLLSTAAVAKAAKVGRETLRFYEEKGMIKPIARTAVGYRQFDVSVVGSIALIKQMQQAGFALKEIQQLLKLQAESADTCGAVAPLLSAKLVSLDAELVVLQSKRDALAALAGICGLKESSRQCGFVRQGPGCC